MSLEDDIFDVRDSLKRKPCELKQFNKIISHLSCTEEELSICSEELSILKKAFVILKDEER